jgi:hypothetical protein
MVEVPCNVIRVCRVIEICCMALIAVSIHQLIVPINVAGLALHGHMRTSKREAGGTVVECRTRPVGGRMTLRTIMTEVTRDVVWIRGLLVFSCMALITVGIHKLVIAVHVA